MKGKKHKWITYDNSKNVDLFGYSEGRYHNGPKCKVCGFGFCHHCFPEGYKTSCPQKKSLGSNNINLDVGVEELESQIKEYMKAGLEVSCEITAKNDELQEKIDDLQSQNKKLEEEVEGLKETIKEMEDVRMP